MESNKSQDTYQGLESTSGHVPKKRATEVGLNPNELEWTWRSPIAQKPEPSKA